MNSKTLNLIIGLASLLAAGFIFTVSRDFPDRAALMPSLIAGIMAIASLVEIFKAYKKPSGGESPFSNVSWPTLILTVAAWFCLLLFSKWVNFFILSALFLFFMALLLGGKPKDIGDAARITVFSIAIPVALWLLFALVLNVSFPVEGVISF